MSAVNPQTVRPPDHWVPKVAVVLAIVGSATIGWLAFGRSDASKDSGTASRGSTSVSADTESTSGSIASTTSIVGSIAETTTTETATTITAAATAVTAPETTLPPAPATTAPAPVETVAPLPPPPSAIVADPTPGALAGPGNHQVMNDAMAGGPAVADVLASYATAQRFADLLAAHDWITAAAMLPTYPYGAEGLAATYGSIDRFSLLLLDARADGGGFTLLLGAVTNDNGGAQTSERCIRWYADSTAVEIQGETVLAQYDVAISAVDIRMNAEEDGRIRNGCIW